MLIKICGLTNADTAYQTALAGADLIGLLFSDCSPRKISLEMAVEISQKARLGGAEIVGVFVDETYEEILHIINTLNLKYVQLHGEKVYDYGYKLAKDIHIIYLANNQPLPNYLSVQRDFLLFDKTIPTATNFRFLLAGNLSSANVKDMINNYAIDGIDVSSSLESSLAIKDINKIRQFISLARPERYGRFGGRFIAELLVAPLKQLEDGYKQWLDNLELQKIYQDILINTLGRPTPITEIKKFVSAIAKNVTSCPRIFLKREDLVHTGAHKINNAVGQCLLAKYMGKTRIIAETGAGQHGVATATACAMLGLSCTIYMGSVDIKRQAVNVDKMKLLGAKVVAVTSGSQTLKDAVNEALRDWAATFDYSHYCLGSALGPYPFPKIVADLQSVIGREAHKQMQDVYHLPPTHVIACIGGGSNAIGIFNQFIADETVKLIGVEAGGRGSGLGNNAARFGDGSIGVLHGSKTYVLQDNNYQVSNTYSISAGLDYPAVGPQHAYLHTIGRVEYTSVTDEQAVSAFKLLTATEGIIPALESSHALAYVVKHIDNFSAKDVLLINLSGRGEKDLAQLLSSEYYHE